MEGPALIMHRLTKKVGGRGDGVITLMITLGGGRSLTDDLDLGNILMSFICVVTALFLEKEMASHSSILAWRILWKEEPGGLQSTESQRVGHD